MVSGDGLSLDGDVDFHGEKDDTLLFYDGFGLNEHSARLKRLCM